MHDAVYWHRVIHTDHSVFTIHHPPFTAGSKGRKMLLGRTANGLYWMNRYIERAGKHGTAGRCRSRMALTRTQNASEEWNSVLLSAGSDAAFTQKYTDYTASNVADFLLRDTSNPSSTMASIETARSNARMVRTALTRETWESINPKPDVAEADTGQADRRTRPAERAGRDQAQRPR